MSNDEGRGKYTPREASLAGTPKTRPDKSPLRWFTLALCALFVAVLACGPIPTLVPTPTRVPPVAIKPTATAPMATATPPLSPVPTATAVPQPSSPITHAVPVIVTEVDLGVRFAQSLQHSVALDVEGGHVFIGVSPTQTLVLSAEDVRLVNTLPAGGDLAIDHVRRRLYVGAPSGLAVFNLDSLQPIGNIPATSWPYGSTPVVDESIGTVFDVRDGVQTIDPVTLQVTGRIAGTFPITPGAESRAIAVDAAFDADQRLVYISLNNGIPGSNNGNTLTIYNLQSTETVYRDDERSVVSLAVDDNLHRLFITRTRLNSHSLTAFAVERGQVTPVWRVNGITGSIKVDAQRGRAYVSDSAGPSPRLLVLNASTGTLIADVPLPRAYTLAAFNVEADQLYLVSSDGHLIVMNGHGAPAPPPAIEASSALTGTVAWIAPSPNFANDQTMFAAWMPGRHTTGSFGALAGNLMMSDDGGSTWNRVAGGLPQHLLVNVLAFSPDFSREMPNGSVFAALLTPDGQGGGIYVSTDAGRSWHPAANGLGDWIVAEIAVAPGFPFNRTAFALTWPGKLLRSTDGGATWQPTGYRASAPVAMNARTLALSPDFVNDHTLIVSAGESAVVSRDSGENWWSLVDDRPISLVFSSSRILLGSFANAGVMRSNDGGATWQAASRGLRFDATGRVMLAPSPDFSRELPNGIALALIRSAEQPAVYRTTDGGTTWQIESSDWASKTQVTTIAFPQSPNGLLFFGTSEGLVHAIKPSELTWSNASVALDKLSVEALALSPDYAHDRTVFIGNRRAGVFVSTDGGKKWAETNLPARDSGTGRLYLALSPDYPDDRTVLAGVGGQVFRSNDSGASWQSLSSGLGNYFPVAAMAVSPQFASEGIVLVGGGTRVPRVMRSTDRGETWSAAKGLPSTGSNGVTALAFVPGALRAQVAYAWTDPTGLYRSGDGGATFTRVFSPTIETSFSLQSLGISPNFARDRLMFASVFGPQSFRRSADGGASWHPSDSGLPLGLSGGSALAISPDFTRDRLIFLGTDKGVFRSEDGGVTWKVSSTGLPQAGVLSLAISPGFSSDRTILAGLAERGLYVSTDGGATWKPTT